ncbi:MAG: peptidylprolyl isomerase [Pseudodesulfovibrio sp.]|uniref:Peptidyl-prolyl cis-trans isomerase n=1 Tax=Pseudodesulfovibrio aespoeensis (strain ATCC 700646 / DSM 10631 / Aspo-2) TaxID=643562 RepID=E6VUX1_PSEA9|nr:MULTISPECIES: peptidylprolyl isomerase [Pseudodesulfovibrio]MBU4191106.1 peptidylprolyl isomerase [Pseudomonadota bacterium]ADU63479.1 peptidylprolyl isomerase FKBP-type [Pseudodesulfovibrio aespoeensis Aspo-2]MBU4244748.1 peptidylprolyl isomerase [Pseudomonadota bacterium]MBU4377708.1 peptidylprolyl isomerase [Pseudomonadota bacterium]MBU4476443.1 peptidylprolyl isomerase [Pseudomonadota bacterium]
MTAKKGSTVKVHYTGTLKEDGSQFDSSQGRDPLQFTLGQGMVIAGFEKAVIGKSVGDTVTVEIPPEEGYGEANDQLVFQVRREQLPPHVELEEGVMLEIRTEDGSPAYVRIANFDDALVTLDGNHPLAGQTLVFEIEVVELT